MTSQIDPNVIVDDEQVDKALVRDQFATAANEITELQNRTSFPRREIVSSILSDSSTGGGSSSDIGINAGSIVAVCRDGYVHVTPPLVSPKMWTIAERSGFPQTAAGSTFDIVFDAVPAGFDPDSEQLTVRCVGRNNANNMLPQVDGTWDVVAVAGNPFRFTLLGTVFGPMENAGGIAYVPGTLIDASPHLIELTEIIRAHGGAKVEAPPRAGIALISALWYFDSNSTYNCNDCFTFKADRIDQPAQFNASVGSGLHPSSPPGNVTAGRNPAKLNINDLWVFDNRGHQVFATGAHAVNLGSQFDPTRVIQRLKLDSVHIRGSSGYGGSTGNTNRLINFVKKNGSVRFTDGDSWDRKDTFNDNDQTIFENEDHDWQALGDQGTNLRMERGLADPFRSLSIGTTSVRVEWKAHGFAVGNRIVITQTVAGNGIVIPTTPLTIATVISADFFTITGTGSSLAVASWGGNNVRILKCMAEDGITVTSGETYIEIPRDTDNACNIGEIATIAGADTSLHGIPLNGEWHIIAKVSNTVLRLSQMNSDGSTNTPAATGSGDGGGATITFVCPHISVGDRLFDARSQRTTLKTVRSKGEFYGRTGFDPRGSSGVEINGASLIDKTPAWVGNAGGGGIGCAMLNEFEYGGGFVSNLFIDAPGAEVGFRSSAADERVQLDKFIIVGTQQAVQVRGSRTTIGKGRIINPVKSGVNVWGYLDSVTHDLPDDAFQPVGVGDPRVIVTSPGHPIPTTTIGDITGITQANPGVITVASHGFVNGNVLAVKDVVGMTEMNGRAGTVTVVNPNSFSLGIDTSGFTAYTSGGKITNRGVRFAAQTNGSGMVIVGSNIAEYRPSYIDANTYYIDASQNVVGDGSVATSTDPFGGDNAEARYGALPHTSEAVTIDGVEFEHTVPGNTAIAVRIGEEEGIGAGDRGRADDTIVRNCRQVGFATPMVDYGTRTLAYGNVGIENTTRTVETFTSSDTFIPNPNGTRFEVICWPGAGGGGSARRGAAGSVRAGGFGGFAGVPTTRTFLPSDLDMDGETITIGAGGTGGAAVAVDDTNGNDGTAGGNTTFGTLLRAIGGFAGPGGLTSQNSPVVLVAGASTTGRQMSGQMVSQTNGTTAAIPATVLSTSAPNVNGLAIGGGAGGTGGSLTTGNAAVDGIQAPWAGWADPAMAAPTGPAAAGVAGTAGSTSAVAGIAGYGGGGGGASVAGAGGAGGAGGRASGGGGGGASVNGQLSGAGGAGGGGQVTIFTYFS